MSAGAAATTAALSRPTFAAANSEVRLAIIGAGWRGGQLAGAFSKATGCRIVTICDPDRELADEMAAKYKATSETDLRQVFEQDNVDAVVIATCNHWHCLASIWALDAGKHVYVEKPLSHTQWEGRQLIAAAAKSNKIVQIGTQQRSDPMQAEAKQLLHQEKALGEIQYVQANRLGVRRPIGKRKKPLAIPSSVDYDLWLGPAADQSLYRDKLHYDWHWDFNTGSGEMGNWGVHILDDVRNVAYQDKVTTPTKVTAAGGRVSWNDAGNTPNVHYALLETDLFPTVLALSNLAVKPGGKSAWNVPLANGLKAPGSGYAVVCEGGVYLGQRGRGKALDLDGRTIREFKGGDIVPLHTQNFVDAVLASDESRLNAPVLGGHHSTGWCNLANVAFQAGQAGAEGEASGNPEIWTNVALRMEALLGPHSVPATELVQSPTLSHDPATETFTGAGSEIANRFLKREYRKGFQIEEIA
ncbi:MAG: Gfo/Idh/MocA family oxidoreductase [Planctomycetota bacterium]